MRQVLPVIGAVVGAYIGSFTGNTAQGAQIGWAIGSAVGNAVDPQVIKGPSIGDLGQQTGQEGVPRPIVFGLSQPMSGNIVYCSTPKIVTKKQRQGKGGPVTETQSVYRTYAIGICEGPITELVRAWNNGRLVYDVRPGHEIDNNSKFLGITRIFLGDYDQMPSSDIEALVGAANTPAMRGTAYIVRVNEDLTSAAGAVPQFVFQVMRCEGTVLTSEVYPFNVIEEVSFNVRVGEMTIHTQQYTTTDQDNNISFNVVPGTMTLHSIVQTYNAPPEAVSYLVAPGDMTIHTITKTYNAPAEAISYSAHPGDMTINTIVITYNSPAEKISYSVSPGAMTITTT